MAVFADIENRLPPATVVVPPKAFADTWRQRPGEDVCIGLRTIPDGDLEDARVEAYRRAKDLFPDHEKSPASLELFVASFQDALVRWVIARGTCDPNDVLKAWNGWVSAPEDMARDYLTDHGAQLIFDAWEKMRIEANIGLVPASDEDLADLPILLARLPLMAADSASRAMRIRRLLRFVLEELASVEEPE